MAEMEAHRKVQDSSMCGGDDGGATSADATTVPDPQHVAADLRKACKRPFFKAKPPDDAASVITSAEQRGLDADKFINIGNENGKTALMYASQLSGSADLVSFLLDKGADPNATTHRGQSPVVFAAGKGRDETLRVLLARGGSCRVRTVTGDTPSTLGASKLEKDTLTTVKQLEEDGNGELWKDFTADPRALAAQREHEKTCAGCRRRLGLEPLSASKRKGRNSVQVEQQTPSRGRGRRTAEDADAIERSTFQSQPLPVEGQESSWYFERAQQLLLAREWHELVDERTTDAREDTAGLRSHILDEQVQQQLFSLTEHMLLGVAMSFSPSSGSRRDAFEDMRQQCRDLLGACHGSPGRLRCFLHVSHKRRINAALKRLGILGKRGANVQRVFCKSLVHAIGHHADAFRGMKLVDLLWHVADSSFLVDCMFAFSDNDAQQSAGALDEDGDDACKDRQSQCSSAVNDTMNENLADVSDRFFAPSLLAHASQDDSQLSSLVHHRVTRLKSKSDVGPAANLLRLLIGQQFVQNNPMLQRVVEELYPVVAERLCRHRAFDVLEQFLEFPNMCGLDPQQVKQQSVNSLLALINSGDASPDKSIKVASRLRARWSLWEDETLNGLFEEAILRRMIHTKDFFEAAEYAEGNTYLEQLTPQICGKSCDELRAMSIDAREAQMALAKDLDLEIVVVDTVESLRTLTAVLQRAVADLLPHDRLRLGLDSEWRDPRPACSIVQLSLGTQVWILDTFVQRGLSQDYVEELAAFMAWLFSDPRLLLLGFGFSDDCRHIEAISPRKLIPVIGASVNVIDVQDLAVERLKMKRKPSLERLADTLVGIPLQKQNQCSNWERRPLRPDQVAYAAVDAAILPRLYHALVDK